jgi:hypothetical protein
MDTAQIEAVPLATGSFTGLATQSTGVSAELGGGTGANSGLGNAPIWANGQRDTSNSFLLNGVDASNLFNGKSTSQVSSSRVINSTGVPDQPRRRRRRHPLRGLHLPHHRQRHPHARRLKPSPKSASTPRCTTRSRDPPPARTSISAPPPAPMPGTAQPTPIAAPTGSTPLHSSSTRIPTFRPERQGPGVAPLHSRRHHRRSHRQGQALWIPRLSAPARLRSGTRRLVPRCSRWPVSDDRSANALTNLSNNSFGANVGNSPITAANIDPTPSSCSIHPRFPASPASGSSPTTPSTASLPPLRTSTTPSFPARRGLPPTWPWPTSTTTPPRRTRSASSTSTSTIRPLPPTDTPASPDSTSTSIPARRSPPSPIPSCSSRTSAPPRRSASCARKTGATMSRPSGPAPSPAARPAPDPSTCSDRTTSPASRSTTYLASTSRLVSVQFT